MEFHLELTSWGGNEEGDALDGEALTAEELDHLELEVLEGTPLVDVKVRTSWWLMSLETKGGNAPLNMWVVEIGNFQFIAAEFLERAAAWCFLNFRLKWRVQIQTFLFVPCQEPPTKRAKTQCQLVFDFYAKKGDFRRLLPGELDMIWLVMLQGRLIHGMQSKLILSQSLCEASWNITRDGVLKIANCKKVSRKRQGA